MLFWGRSDHPRTPKDTPGYPRTHLISYIIHLFTHLFIHLDENKTKMASNSFHFQVHSFEKVLLNTADTDLLTHILNETLHDIFHVFFIFFLLLLS